MGSRVGTVAGGRGAGRSLYRYRRGVQGGRPGVTSEVGSVGLVTEPEGAGGETRRECVRWGDWEPWGRGGL